MIPKNQTQLKISLFSKRKKNCDHRIVFFQTASPKSHFFYHIAIIFHAQYHCCFFFETTAKKNMLPNHLKHHLKLHLKLPSHSSSISSSQTTWSSNHLKLSNRKLQSLLNLSRLINLEFIGQAFNLLTFLMINNNLVRYLQDFQNDPNFHVPHNQGNSWFSAATQIWKTTPTSSTSSTIIWVVSISFFSDAKHFLKQLFTTVQLTYPFVNVCQFLHCLVTPPKSVNFVCLL